MSELVPLSVRHGNRRKKLGWAILGYRERLALRLAPWLTPHPEPCNPPPPMPAGWDDPDREPEFPRFVYEERDYS